MRVDDTTQWVRVMDSSQNPSSRDDHISIAINDQVVTAVGEIDADTAPELASAIESIPGDVKVDLAGIEFMDSSGIRVLIDAHQALAAHSHTLTLVRPAPAVMRVLELSNLDSYLVIDQA